MDESRDGEFKIWLNKNRGNRPNKDEIDFLRYVLFPTIMPQCNDKDETLMQDCTNGNIMRINFYDIKASCMFLDDTKDVMVFTDVEKNIYISYKGMYETIVFNLIDISKKELLKLNI